MFTLTMVISQNPFIACAYIVKEHFVMSESVEYRYFSVSNVRALANRYPVE